MNDERHHRLDEERAALEKKQADHAAAIVEDERRIAVGREAVRAQLATVVAMETELQRDMAEQRAEVAATKRALSAAAALQQDAEADRAAAATERAAVRDLGNKLNAHRDRLLPTLQAARDFRQQIAALKGQPLSPMASSTRAAVDALARASMTVVPPPHETRPDVIAQYAHISRQGAAIGS